MTSLKQIEKLEQQVNKLETKKALEKIKHRKADTRQKIELGGLMIKSKLHKFPKNVILGALIESEKKLTDKEFFNHCQLIGDCAFLENQKST